MSFAELDWPALERLRERFLEGAPSRGPYWTSPSELESYDRTYGERIGWKWDQVLRELELRRWQPPPRARAVFDFGCGSGVASRRVLARWGAQLESLVLWDHSPLAAEFAAARASREFPSLRVERATAEALAADSGIGLLVVCHVLNELDARGLDLARRLAARADALVWVEPGTHADSRRLGELRDELRGSFRVVAPCTHTQPCPMLAAGNERHWCHFFAPPAPGTLADSDWVRFGQRAGIDLRSAPYAFVALERAGAGGPPPADTGLARVIGRIEEQKPGARLTSCDAAGLARLELHKRAAPALYKELERSREPRVYRFRREGNRIVGGEPA